MKIYHSKIYIAGFILAAAAIILQQNIVIAAETDKTVYVTGTAIKPVTPGPVLDDFTTNSSLNKWSCATGVFGSLLTGTTNTGYCIKSWSSPGTLKLDYDVRNSKSFSGYYSKMGGGSLAGYKSVSFRVKGAMGGEVFKVEFKVKLSSSDPDRDHGAVYVTSYLDGGVSTAGWKPVTIPFDNFANISDWASVSEFVITFENSQSAAAGGPLQSAVYIDDIVFNTAKPPAIRAGYFDDKIPIDSLGGNLWAGGSSSGTTASFSFEADTGPSGTGKNSLRCDYSGLYIDNTRWAAVSFPIGGGADGTKKIPHDFSGYSAISFYIRGSNVTNGVKVELHDFKGQGAGEPFFLITYAGLFSDPVGPFGTSWKKYTIPFSSFKNYSGVALDPSRIAEIVFSVDYWNAPAADLTFNIVQVQFE